VFEQWTGDGRPVRRVDLTSGDAIGAFDEFYGGTDRGALRADRGVLLEVLDHAYRLGAQTAFIEYRYVDLDYRNEHSRFYSTTFRRYPSVAHRIHLFSGRFDEQPDGDRPFYFRNRGYLGYVVMRPVQAAPVGRTMLQIPPGIASSAVICLAQDTVNLMGTDLTVTGVPFYAQDAQLGRCGQAAIMSVAYYHHRVFGRARLLPGEIADAVDLSGHELGRAIPSPGLNIAQIVDAATAIGLPPVVHDLGQLRKATFDVEAEICRYLNSRLPVIVATHGHAFLVVGYDRRDNPDGGQDIRFLRQDDEAGPYQWVDNWHIDARYGTWQYLIVPLPRKVYLTGVLAEGIGERKLRHELRRSGGGEDTALLERVTAPDSDLSWRSTVMPSNDFKRSVSARGLPDRLAAAYQWVHLPRYVWVVELTDRKLRDDRKPCVVADVVIDATDHARDPRPLLWRTPSGLGRYLSDVDATTFDGSLRHEGYLRSVVEIYAPHRPSS
jgi:hypothetical protein